uniref:Phosphatidylinositol-4,5-bisphosphate 4-phosphatase n=1 Tax=Schistosoma haematobium TaxID=6185 RepID=A0A095B1Z6_SCHHA
MLALQILCVHDRDTNQLQPPVQLLQIRKRRPIKGPPTGKQYVRCPCNCLLVCNESTSKVGCPRPECQKVIVIREEDGVGFMGSSNRFLQGPATHGTFGTPQSLRLSCGNCNSPFSIPSPESHSFGRMNAFTALLSGRNASNAAGLITARCPHCHKVTSVGPAYARAHWIGYGVLAIVAIIIAISVTAGTAEAAIGNNALYFLWSNTLALPTLGMSAKGGEVFGLGNEYVE